MTCSGLMLWTLSTKGPLGPLSITEVPTRFAIRSASRMTLSHEASGNLASIAVVIIFSVNLYLFVGCSSVLTRIISGLDLSVNRTLATCRADLAGYCSVKLDFKMDLPCTRVSSNLLMLMIS